MKIFGTENNENILKELGQRLKDIRIAIPLTQKELAQRAGVSSKTVERVENGENVRITHIINILRTMNLTENLDLLVPEQTLSPTQLHDYGKKRKRAVSMKKTVKDRNDWKWGDEQ